MDRKEFLLSIAIPTKDRENYCIEAIKHILSYDNSNFELVIQDNSGSNLIKEFVADIDDFRLCYFYTNEKISSVENMSRAIGHTQGEYICMIGDDDTVLPSIFDVVKKMKNDDIDSLASRDIPAYVWPVKDDNKTAILKVMKHRRIQRVEIVNTKERLKKLFANGILNYQRYNLPRVYHGIVKRELMSDILDKIGAYFGGLSPDIYSTVVLSHLVNKHYVINKAITIAGACPASTTYQSNQNNHNGKISDAPHLKNNSYTWDHLIPEVYSVETIWAETAIRAARDFDLNYLVGNFNFNKLSVELFSKNRNIESLILQKINEASSINISKSRLVFLSIISRGGNLLRLIFTRLFVKHRKTFRGIEMISDCVSKCK